MTLPATGSYEALWGTLSYLFHTEIARPLEMSVHWLGSGFVATEATTWAHVTLRILERGGPRRSHPFRGDRFGRSVRAELDVTLLVREESGGEGRVDTRRGGELADRVRQPWPVGRSLPFYDTRVATLSTVSYGWIHVVDVKSEALDPLPSGVMRHGVRFGLRYLEESEA